MQQSQGPSPNRHLTRAQHWQHTRRLTCILLVVWFAVTAGIVMYARPLSTLTWFGWPVSYYMAAQGAILLYVAIVGFYTWRMAKLDERLADDEDGHGA